MSLELFWRGLLLGFSIAAPVGPIGLLCIQRTLLFGRIAGLTSGLGAATADACYGLVAALGLTLVSNFLVAQGFWLRLLGSLFLLYLGIRTFLARPAEKAARSRVGGLGAAYLSTFLLTLANPMTILSFAASFAGLGLGSVGPGVAGGLLLVVGVFCGSALWWLLLSGGVSLFRSRLTTQALAWVNRLAGSVLVGFAIYLLFSLRW